MLRRYRIDSVKELKDKKTISQLQQENEELKEKVNSLETELTNTSLALCDVYEQVLALTSTEGE